MHTFDLIGHSNLFPRTRPGRNTHIKGRHLSAVTDEERKAIRRQYRVGFKTMTYLAKTHNVGTSAIRAICLQDA